MSPADSLTARKADARVSRRETLCEVFAVRSDDPANPFPLPNQSLKHYSWNSMQIAKVNDRLFHRWPLGKKYQPYTR